MVGDRKKLAPGCGANVTGIWVSSVMHTEVGMEKWPWSGHAKEVPEGLGSAMCTIECTQARGSALRGQAQVH